jgi:enterochelin esterase-like enzyme
MLRRELFFGCLLAGMAACASAPSKPPRDAGKSADAEVTLLDAGVAAADAGAAPLDASEGQDDAAAALDAAPSDAASPSDGGGEPADSGTPPAVDGGVDPCAFGTAPAAALVDPRRSVPASRLHDLESCVAQRPSMAGDLVNAFVTEVLNAGALPWDNGMTAVLFLGDASSITVSGSFDNWPSPGMRAFRNIPGTQLNVAQIPVARDGRAQYKLTRHNSNGSVDWSGDPLNPWIKWDGIDRGGPGQFNAEAAGPDHMPTSSFLYRMFVHDREVYLQLPVAHFTTQTSMGVFYLQDGNELLTRAGLEQVVDDTIAAGHQPLAVAYVALPNQNVRHADYEWGAGMLGDTYVALVADEIVPVVEAHVRTSMLPDMRGIGGVHSGGLIAFYAAWIRNDVFERIGAESAGLDWNSDDLIHRVEMGPMHTLSVYLDSSMGSVDLPANQRMDTALTAAGYAHQFSVAGAGETWSFWAQRFPALQAYLFP